MRVASNPRDSSTQCELVGLYKTSEFSDHGVGIVAPVTVSSPRVKKIVPKNHKF